MLLEKMISTSSALKVLVIKIYCFSIHTLILENLNSRKTLKGFYITQTATENAFVLSHCLISKHVFSFTLNTLKFPLLE